MTIRQSGINKALPYAFTKCVIRSFHCANSNFSFFAILKLILSSIDIVYSKAPMCEDEKMGAMDQKSLQKGVTGAAECSKPQTKAENVEVFLRVYDLSKGMAKAISKQLLGVQLDGIWHTSIEVYGNEYYFQSGLFCKAAGTTHYGEHVERLSLGFTSCSKEDLELYFEGSKGTWTPDSYHLFENNCNNFSDYLAFFLVQKNIPSHILELPDVVKQAPGFQNLFMRRS